MNMRLKVYQENCTGCKACTLACSFFHTGASSYTASRLYIEKALKIDYTDSLAHFSLGMIMKQSRDYNDAEIHFLIALDINPNFVVCMLEMVLLQLKMKNQIKAKIYYQKARAISPAITDAKLNKVLGY